MKDKLNAVKTVLCAVFAAGCAVLGFFFWDASDRAGALLEENDALREQLSVTQSDAKNAAAAAAELQEQVDEMTAQIDELNSRLEQAARTQERQDRWSTLRRPAQGTITRAVSISESVRCRCRLLTRKRQDILPARNANNRDDTLSPTSNTPKKP